ncbi:hypothetical protein AAL_03459 [Moelleriella libera RCEF 2490]|uniref:Kynurenine formamidase n=1 Tax=Moelleriella libera RCEF 2490 TaxID=1081109 RepID=A0A168D910_9HYPO|nr:hypothetical protein AAL_03459 [Moelleriella libera RCEF 2490]
MTSGASSANGWSSIAWEESRELAVPMWHKTRVPYLPSPNSLQHVDVWIPTASSCLASSSPRHQLPASWIPPPNALWIIYVHGGAWRDPLITSATLTPALKQLPLTDDVVLASVSYSLSRYTQHATQPSSPADCSRNAMHPRHILDVLAAIGFLQETAGFGSNYILAGHSCGATLAFQAAMDPARWRGGETESASIATRINDSDSNSNSNMSSSPHYLVQRPAMILGLNGLYDMPQLCHNPGGVYNDYRDSYEEITRGAFGDDERAWAAVSPALVEDWAAEWPEGKCVLLMQSPQDSLVPFAQAEGMRDSLRKTMGPGLRVELVDGYGDHDDTWEKGTLLAEGISRAIKEMLPSQ